MAADAPPGRVRLRVLAKFFGAVGFYQPGDTGDFDADVAQGLVAKKIAEVAACS